jgi:mannan polymerase II complex MNN10 subunit
MRHTPEVSEQGVMKSVLESSKEFENSKHFLKIPQYMLNAYPEEIPCIEDSKRPWRSGDWIIHFPVSLPINYLLTGQGAWSVMKESKDPFGVLLRRYWPRIVE